MNQLNGIHNDVIRYLILGKDRTPPDFEDVWRGRNGNPYFKWSDHRPYSVQVKFK